MKAKKEKPFKTYDDTSKQPDLGKTILWFTRLCNSKEHVLVISAGDPIGGKPTKLIGDRSLGPCDGSCKEYLKKQRAVMKMMRTSPLRRFFRKNQ